MDWISALGKGFERLLRWAYPGILFLVLLYMSKPTVFEDVSKKVGFPDNTIWGLLIGGLGCVFRTKSATISEQTGRPFGVK